MRFLFTAAATALLALATPTSAITPYQLTSRLTCITDTSKYRFDYILDGLTEPAQFSTDVYEAAYRMVSTTTKQPFNLPPDTIVDSTVGGWAEVSTTPAGSILHAQQTAGSAKVSGQIILGIEEATAAGLSCNSAVPNVELQPLVYPVNGISQLVVNSYDIINSNYSKVVGSAEFNPMAPVYSFNITAQTNLDPCFIDPNTQMIRVPWKISGLAVTNSSEKGTVSVLVTNPNGDLLSSWSLAPEDGMLIGRADRDPAEPSIFLAVQPPGPIELFGRLDFEQGTAGVQCVNGTSNIMLEIIDYSTLELASAATAFHYIPGSSSYGLDKASQLDTSILQVAAAGTLPKPPLSKCAARRARAAAAAAAAKKKAQEAAAAAAAAAAVPGTDTPCTLTVPANPLSALGLATPYILGGGCKMNADTAGFVQGAIISPSTGKIQVYNPLVVEQGKKAAIDPVIPQLPADAVVGLWFGSQAGLQQLVGPGLAQGNCVTGINVNGKVDIFGQFAYCNADAFFKAVAYAVFFNKLQVPALGNAADGRPCPTTRDFSVVDQDPSDNVITKYIVTADGNTAINSPGNLLKLQSDAAAAKKNGPTVLANGSDNGLVAGFIKPALGCSVWKVEDLSAPGTMASALPLNEIQAAVFQPQPIARIPAGDPMTLVNGKPNIAKLNALRVGVAQAQVASLGEASTKTFCKQMVGADGANRILTNRQRFLNVPGPVAGQNLNAFLVDRFAAAVGPANLGCGALIPGLTNPLAGGAVIAAKSAFTVASALLVDSAQLDNQYSNFTAELLGVAMLETPGMDETAMNANTSSKSSSFPLAIVIGAAAGGVALIVLLIVAITIRQKRKANTVITTTHNQVEGRV